MKYKLQKKNLKMIISSRPYFFATLQLEAAEFFTDLFTRMCKLIWLWVIFRLSLYYAGDIILNTFSVTIASEDVVIYCLSQYE